MTNVFDLVAINTAAAYGQGNYFLVAPAWVGAVTAEPRVAPAGKPGQRHGTRRWLGHTAIPKLPGVPA